MKKVFLHGRLGEEFGKEFDFVISSPIEAIRALEANFPNRFRRSISEGYYRVSTEKFDVDLEHCVMETGCEEIHIEPVLQGAGGDSKGLLTIIAGFALVATGVGTPLAAGLATEGGLSATVSILGAEISFGAIALTGAALALNGISTLLTPVPRANSNLGQQADRPEDRNSFLFQQATNNVAQGGPVPLIYGRHWAGSTVVSGGLTVEAA
jgi:predicted phage tail protein